MQYATPIYQFFCNKSIAFIVPLYQRKYAWESINCKRLWDDLMKARDLNVKSHFFGTIVTVQESLSDPDLLVIDGQQRITTLSLIFLAIRNAVKNGDMFSSDPMMLEELLKDYLYAIFRKSDRKQKLCPIKQDRNAFDALFTNNPDEFVKDSGITTNYQLFYNLIKSTNISAEELKDALQKLIVIDLRLDVADNPQLIFESLNSTGKDLTEADKVRNYMLMSLDKETQTEYYNNYWSKIERLTDGDPTMFIRDYLTVRLRRICNIANLYFDFKEYDANADHSREAFMQDLLKYAAYYNRISHANTGKSAIDKKLRQLSSIGSAVGNPFYMSFFDYADKNSLSDDEVYNVLDTIENYWARRIMCNYPANSLNKVFSTLHYDILKVFQQHAERKIPLTSSYSELLKYILLRKQGTAQFPRDEELNEMFFTRQVYRLPIDYRYFLFERMENENSKDGIRPVVEKMKEGQITIEHIMPQTLNAEWKRMLGQDYEEIHEKYLHTFANLTLTGFNTEYGNRPFLAKRDGFKDKKGNCIDGFKQANFHLSKYLITCDTWNEDNIKERGKDMLKRFKGMWPMISTSYEALEKDVDIVSLAEADELTGRSIVGFSFDGVYHDVTSWKEMIVALCAILYKKMQPEIEQLCGRNEWWLYSHQENNWRTQFAENCWVSTQNDTKTKRSIILHIFEECRLSETDLYFHLVPQCPTEKS